MTCAELLKLFSEVRVTIQNMDPAHDICVIKVSRDRFRKQGDRWQWKNRWGGWELVPESVLPQLIEQLEKE